MTLHLSIPALSALNLHSQHPAGFPRLSPALLAIVMDLGAEVVSGRQNALSQETGENMRIQGTAARFIGLEEEVGFIKRSDYNVNLENETGAKPWCASLPS